VALIALLFAFFLGAEAVAQDCSARDADIFSRARRARAIVADYNKLHRVYRADLARNRAFFKRETGKDMPWRFDLAGVISTKSTFGFEVCTNRGPWGASINPLSAGGLLSVDIFDWGVGVEAFGLVVSNSLKADPTEAQTRTPDGGFREPVGLAYVNETQAIYGGRLILHDWASLVVGWIESAPIDNQPGRDGRVIDAGELSSEYSQRWYIGLASPFGDTSFHILYEPEDVSSDLIELRAAALPLPIDFDAVGVLGVAYIEDESQVALEMGVDRVFDFLSLNSQLEFNPIRVRALKARVEWDGGPELILRSEDSDPSPQVDNSGALRLALDLGAFAEATYFNSRYLEERTGRDHVFGAAFGLSARPDATIAMLQIDLWTGINRPAELARISDFVDHWQFGARFHGRFGL
jgi:hypothetical protein